MRHIVIVPPWGRSVTDFRCGWCLESFSFLTKSRFTPPCPRTFATATAATNIVNFMKKINHVVLDYTISLGVVLGHPKTIWFKSNALPRFPFKQHLGHLKILKTLKKRVVAPNLCCFFVQCCQVKKVGAGGLKGERKGKGKGKTAFRRRRREKGKSERVQT